MKMPNFNVWVILLVATLAVAIFFLGSNSGAKSVQEKWDAHEKERELALDKEISKQNALSRQHSYEVGVLTNRLKEATTSYETTISTITDNYTSRLQQSEKRASVYQRQANTGAIECRSLASHAAQLDSSLEQGRQLVEELRATIRLRDNQLTILGSQIQADRKLLE